MFELTVSEISVHHPGSWLQDHVAEAAHLFIDGKQRETKRLEPRCNLQGMLPVTCFFHLASHLLNLGVLLKIVLAPREQALNTRLGDISYSHCSNG